MQRINTMTTKTDAKGSKKKMRFENVILSLENMISYNRERMSYFVTFTLL